MNDVIILAGGLGTRLSHVVSNTQKAMAPIKGMPFLYYLLKSLKTKGVERAVLAVSHLSSQVESYFGNRFEGMEIAYSRETEPLGTGGAIKQALGLCGTENVFIMNGDTFFDIDLHLLNDLHTKSGSPVTLSVRRVESCGRSGNVVFDQGGKVLSFGEKKKTGEGYINGGIYLVKKDIEPLLPNGKFSFEALVLESMVFPMQAAVFSDYFIDIGVPGDYFRAQTEIPLLLGDNKYKAAFLDRDGVICREKHHLYKKEDFEFIEGVPQALMLLREMGYLVIVVTNQAGVAKGLYTEEDVKALHRYMTDSLPCENIINGIYYCPFHPEGAVEKYRLNSPLRKPAPGMIEKACGDFAEKGIEIDLESSLIFGDTERDIQTGINGKIGKKILLRSGHEIPDEKISKADGIYDTLPCYVIEQLNSKEKK